MNYSFLRKSGLRINHGDAVETSNYMSYPAVIS
jgi:hypothetical protein